MDTSWHGRSDSGGPVGRRLKERDGPRPFGARFIWYRPETRPLTRHSPWANHVRQLGEGCPEHLRRKEWAIEVD